MVWGHRMRRRRNTPGLIILPFSIQISDGAFPGSFMKKPVTDPFPIRMKTKLPGDPEKQRWRNIARFIPADEHVSVIRDMGAERAKRL